MPDDGGVLGNLPRSRPGQRSEKRARAKAADGAAGGTAKTTAKAATRAERSGSKAATPPREATRPRSSARPKAAAGARRAAGAAAGEDRTKPSSGDPLDGAIRGVVGIAATGARVASGVARELLRRVPRP
jgi:hypothetical protein